MALAPLSQTIFLTEDGSTLTGQAPVTIPPLVPVVLGALTLPGPPLRFFEADGTEVTRKDHLAPPTLDQHGPSVRAWLQDDPDKDDPDTDGDR